MERFGDTKPRSVAEILAIAVQALADIGISDITIDLHFPAVMPSLLANLPPESHPAIRDAVRLKDTARLRQLNAAPIAELIEIAGAASNSMPALAAIAHRGVSEAMAELSALITELDTLGVPAKLSIDMLDLSGYGYYTGIGYALYWNKAGLEVGRGGCYRSETGEDAVGFTLYINDLLEQLPEEPSAPMAEIPYGTAWEEILKKQRNGFVTVLV